MSCISMDSNSQQPTDDFHFFISVPDLSSQFQPSVWPTYCTTLCGCFIKVPPLCMSILKYTLALFFRNHLFLQYSLSPGKKPVAILDACLPSLLTLPSHHVQTIVCLWNRSHTNHPLALHLPQFTLLLSFLNYPNSLLTRSLPASSLPSFQTVIHILASG